MTQRTWAALVAVPLFVALGLYVAVAPLPFVTYAPGPTINVLGETDGKPIIEVSGHPTYRDSGQLRMTTVSVTQRDAKLGLFALMQTWFSRDDAVYPYEVQYPATGNQKQDTQEGRVEMVTSQDAAVAAALRQLHIPIHPAVEIVSVTDGFPAAGKLQPHDILRRVGDTPITSTTAVGPLIAQVPAGGSVAVTVERQGKPVTVHLKPVTRDGHRLIGVTLQASYTFPFQVSVHISDAIGGPSAGLMFATSIYDTLTPGSLTDGQVVAGTGTIDATGKVGPIGGIQQKIAGARQDGAKLFLVPAANCDDAPGGDNGSMRLVRVATLSQAISSIEAWTANHDAPLPACAPAKAES